MGQQFYYEFVLCTGTDCALAKRFFATFLHQSIIIQSPMSSSRVAIALLITCFGFFYVYEWSSASISFDRKTSFNTVTTAVSCLAQPGSYCDSNSSNPTAAIPCPEKTFSNISKALACRSCPVGQYPTVDGIHIGPGATNCSAIPAWWVPVQTD